MLNKITHHADVDGQQTGSLRQLLKELLGSALPSDSASNIILEAAVDRQYKYKPVACYTDADVSQSLRQHHADRHPGVPAPSSATRSIAGLRCSDHITDTLASLHWLRSSEHIQYKLATTVFQSLHGLAPPYLFDDLHRLVDIPSRRRLRSASSLQLDVPRTHRRTVGDRAFAAAGPTLWNSLPLDITDCVSLTSFCQKPKTFLFSILFP